jgi:POT family proton-dependent oligopeptide transporter
VAENYLQNKLNDEAVPGALGLGQSMASNISYGFLFFSYLTPLLFAIVSDTWLGRYKTLCISLGFYICGAAVLFATSLPMSLRHHAGIPGFVTAMLLIGLGVGGVKAIISPFLRE